MEQYQYPFTGPYKGEPELYEILHLKEWQDLYGKNKLSIYKTCPACDSPKAIWTRNEWAICFDCLIAFDAWEIYYDLSEMDKPEDYEEVH